MFLNPRYAECAHKNILLLLPHPLRHVERRVMMMIIEPTIIISRELFAMCARYNNRFRRKSDWCLEREVCLPVLLHNRQDFSDLHLEACREL